MLEIVRALEFLGPVREGYGRDHGVMRRHDEPRESSRPCRNSEWANQRCTLQFHRISKTRRRGFSVTAVDPPAETAADLDQLRAELVVTRRRRMDIQQDAQRRAQLEAALIVAERDADALVTSSLTEHRRTNEAIAAELTACCAYINRTRVLAAKVDAAALRLDGSSGLHAGPACSVRSAGRRTSVWRSGSGSRTPAFSCWCRSCRH